MLETWFMRFLGFRSGPHHADERDNPCLSGREERYRQALFSITCWAINLGTNDAKTSRHDAWYNPVPKRKGHPGDDDPGIPGITTVSRVTIIGFILFHQRQWALNKYYVVHVEWMPVIVVWLHQYGLESNRSACLSLTGWKSVFADNVHPNEKAAIRIIPRWHLNNWPSGENLAHAFQPLPGQG